MRSVASDLPLHVHVSVDFSSLQAFTQTLCWGSPPSRETMILRSLGKANNIARIIPLLLLMHSNTCNRTLQVIQLSNHVPPQILATTSLWSSWPYFFIFYFFNPSCHFSTQFPESSDQLYLGANPQPPGMSTWLVPHLPPSGFSVDSEAQDATETAWSPHTCNLKLQES